jgi:hypothetical protein
LLPAALQRRRADATEVGTALARKAAGMGHRRIAAALGRSPSTVLLGMPTRCTDRLGQKTAPVVLRLGRRRRAAVSLLAKVSVGRPFRVENGVVVALSTLFFDGPSRPFTSRALGIASWALHCCR